MLSITPTVAFIKQVVLGLAIFTALVTTRFTKHIGEYFALLLLAVVGLMLLVSSKNLLLIFVSLELLSVSLYAMIAKVFEEAETYPGTSMIIAYAPCIAHGFGFAQALEQQKLAVDTGYWPVYRFDPRRVAQGQPGLKLDSPAPKSPLEQFWATQTRFQQIAPERSHGKRSGS